MPTRRSRHLIGFAIVGGIGFAMDAGVLTLLSQGLEFNIHGSRLASFLVATLGTWMLNRSFVFNRDGEPRKKGSEYLRYLSVQIVGGLVNLAIFTSLILMAPAWATRPVVPLAVASLCAMVFNYLGSKHLVFAQGRAGGAARSSRL